MKANKGEWSEFYAFLKILEDKKLFAADKNLDTIADKFFTFKTIIKNETNEVAKIFHLEESEIRVLNPSGEVLKVINNQALKGKAKRIFEKIQNSTTRTFSISEAEILMKQLLCTQVKAGSANKSDIDCVIHDGILDEEKELGFSIKSMVGSASTLLNAGKTTNFIYEISNLDADKIDAINAINSKSKIKDRFFSIVENNATLTFVGVSKDEFGKNLRKIDTVLPIFIAQMLLDYFSGKANEVSELITLLAKNEQLTTMYQLSVSDYEFKIKNLLIAAALGMVPSKTWDGFTKASGGYIVVKDSGEVVCYHLYDRDDFLEYLYRNTKFDSPSSSRHDYGKIYQQDGKMYFNLNLQIRFLK